MTDTAATSRAVVSPGAVGIVLASLLFQQLGASVAVLIFPATGPWGIVSIRLAFAAVILLVIARPSLRGRSRADWWTVIAFGVALGGMNMLYYLSLDHIPLGATATIELLGPLVLAVVAARSVAGWLSALIAAAGVVLLGWGAFTDLNPLGVGAALGAAALWAAYILLSARTGARFAKVEGLALAMAVGTIIALPVGIADAGAAILDWRILALGFAVALLSSAIPYALELVALRRLSPATFSILVSLNPAFAALCGLVILHQSLAGTAVAGVALVAGASVIAVLAANRAGRAADATAGNAVTPD